ncbi:MAG: hypothetical protein GF383_11385, partial [Candidatus Lokiarchaeota archaeon]|nr:hypothetical protein [Candidatus Lokiarchaeota archaeon]MBD3341317.1 hypothetical protein [Candidatus Lokiarchaeota archaeon]
MSNEKTLVKFVELMAKEISDSDLDLVNLGKSLGLDLVLFQDLRKSQEDSFVDMIRERALKKMEINNDNILKEIDYFYAGSIDFMVCDEPSGKKFFLLETNGGSNRGLSILTKKQQSMIYDGYYESILQAISSDKRKDGKTLVLVGVPINDGLIHEKVIMIEYFRNKLHESNYKVAIFNVDNFIEDFDADIAFLIADYKQLSEELEYSDNWVIFRDSAKVSVLIGDGIARRLHNDDFQNLILEDFRKIKTIIVNPVFKITDDKSLTYLASYFAKELLEKYNLKYLMFTKAFNENDLLKKLTHIIENYDKPFIIKPNGGSGGAGVIPISPNEDRANLKDIIEKSKKEFFAKFMKNRNPYPYTIQEMAQFCLIDWKNGKHTYDIRIYMAQKDGKIVPIGGLARIARGNYQGNLDKQEFVVNL